MDAFQLKLRRVESQMPSLQMRLGIQSDASYLQRNSCASKSNPAEAGCWDFWKEMQPSTRNLYPFQSNPTHWVAHNQDSSFLADAPKNRKSWANTSYPRLAFRFTRTEWENQDASDRPEMEDRNSPCPLILYPRRSLRTDLWFNEHRFLVQQTQLCLNKHKLSILHSSYRGGFAPCISTRQNWQLVFI